MADAAEARRGFWGRDGGQGRRRRRRRPRKYGPRSCRICLEEVLPSYDLGTGLGTAFLGRGARPRYVSEDGELGRLMSPCMCRGSQRYVHEGCLASWRRAASGHSSRHMWRCPTCGFQYRMDRLSLGRVLGHWSVHLFITAAVVFLIVFLLGFVGDRVIDFYLDPWGLLFSSPDPPSSHGFPWDRAWDRAWRQVEATWWFHFVKGFMSLGVLGFLKVVVASGTFFLHVGGRGRRRGYGRDRYADMSWTVVMIGSATFIWGVWKTVRSVTRRFLDGLKERVVDVQMDDDDDDDDDDEDDDDDDHDHDHDHDQDDQNDDESRKDR